MYISSELEEDQLLGQRALEAEKEGYLGILESAKLLERLQKKIVEDNKQLKRKL